MCEHLGPEPSSDHDERHEQAESMRWMLTLTSVAAVLVVVVGGAVGQPVLGVFAAVLIAILIALGAVVLAPARRGSFDAASSPECTSVDGVPSQIDFRDHRRTSTTTEGNSHDTAA